VSEQNITAPEHYHYNYNTLPLPEKIVNVLAVFPEEVKGLGVVQVHCLTDINDDKLTLKFMMQEVQWPKTSQCSQGSKPHIAAVSY